MRGLKMAAVIAVIPLVLAACGKSSGSGSTVAVSLQDFKIVPAQASATAGKVTFTVTNDGKAVHEFVVIKTDLAPSEIPVENGEANEKAAGLESMGEVEDLSAGDEKDLTLDLPAGHYVFLCNQPGHFTKGMVTEFQVS